MGGDGDGREEVGERGDGSGRGGVSDLENRWKLIRVCRRCSRALVLALGRRVVYSGVGRYLKTKTKQSTEKIPTTLENVLGCLCLPVC